MKSSWHIRDERFQSFIDYDRKEIDNPDIHDSTRLHYTERAGMVISKIKELFPDPTGIEVVELGCAQANMSLLLAEAGYSVTAVDLRPDALEYSKAKYERGNLRWLQSNILDLPSNLQFDCIVFAEIIEHCAYPERVLESVLDHLKQGGFIVVTTPNGGRIKRHLPTFNDVRSRESRMALESHQFGPGGESHLILFKQGELTELLESLGCVLVHQGYTGSTIFLNKYTMFMVKLFPIAWLRTLIHLWARLPVLNKKTMNTIVAVAKKST